MRFKLDLRLVSVDQGARKCVEFAVSKFTYVRSPRAVRALLRRDYLVMLDAIHVPTVPGGGMDSVLERKMELLRIENDKMMQEKEEAKRLIGPG